MPRYFNWGYFRLNSHAILAQLATEIDAILDAMRTLFLELLATEIDAILDAILAAIVLC